MPAGITSRTAAAGRVRRVGIFGSAFDPPHLAHAALVQRARAQFGLDELRVLPTGEAYHKARALTPAVHRVAMARLAFEGMAEVDDREIRRPGASYTVDTLTELHAEQPNAEWYLLLGADQAQAFPRWHRPRDLLRLAIICVADRADFSSPMAAVQQMAQEDGLSADRVRRLDMPTMDLSATHIRAQIEAGFPPDPWVGTAVARYIAQHHLYSRPR